MSEPTILIIDDNQCDRALALREIKKLFPELQYLEVLDEASLTTALAEKNFDLVVTDYQLLWTTGLNVLYRIKKLMPDCPVVMFTGTGSEEIAVEAMKGGLDDYVIKTPRHYVRLAAAVRSAWQRSQQKQALEEFKQTYYRFFERVPLGLYRQNSTGEISEANSTLTKMLGYNRTEDLQGKTLIDCYIEPQLYLQWQQQLNGTETAAEFEGQVRRLDGKTIWIRQNAIAVKNDRGMTIGYEGAIADITNRKQAELERVELLQRERQAREEAEAVNRIKDEFLATLSHELRTPLNAILGWMQLLRSGKMSSSQTNKALDVIDRNARAQNQLIDDLLDVSHIIRGTLKLDLESVNVVEIIQASLDTVSPGIKAKNIKVITQFDADTIMVNGDEKRLQQVFWNLFINALKFTPENGTITINSEVRGRSVIVEVKDTGKGISPEVLPYVFDRFRQAETKSSTRTQGGLGLGLAIVRHIVEIHGGDVMADSLGLDRGSTFTIKLPLQQSTDEVVTDSANDDDLSLQGLKILLVEDDADSREAFSITLEQHGAEVIAVESVKQAFAEYNRQQLDFIISDLAMPEGDGYSLINTIRNGNDEKSRILAIALTAYATEKDKRRAYSAGFDLHISKPVQFDKLVESLLSLRSRPSK